MTAPTILLVEDDPALRMLTARALQENGFNVRPASAAPEMWLALDSGPVDLVLLDIMLPGTSGIDLCRSLRQKSDVPIIFMSARSSETDRVVGLELGADDYIAKPFSQRLLIARIRAILRRTELNHAADPGQAEANPPLERGRLTMDPARHRVTWKDAPVTLTVTEFLILETLAQRPGIVKTRNQLMDAAYQDDIYVDDRTIDSHIKRVRRKFREVDPEFDSIETLYGAGYRFSEE